MLWRLVYLCGNIHCKVKTGTFVQCYFACSWCLAKLLLRVVAHSVTKEDW